MSLADWINERPERDFPCCDPTPWPHTCDPARIQICRACDADEKAAEDA